MTLMIITGRSGSGKTVALNTLADYGYYCIDNLPMVFLKTLPQVLNEKNDKVAVSIDARNLPQDDQTLDQVFQEFKQSDLKFEVLYLDADDATLLKRFSETRRKHPLSNENVTLKEAINLERELLSPLIQCSDLTIQTTHLSKHDLHQLLSDHLTNKQHGKMALLFQSFGFKNGIPPDSDYVFDVRCLPNPYWQTELRELTGLDKAVQNYLSGFEDVNNMRTSINNLLKQWIGAFDANQRSYLTLSIGCTGGKHRSVFLAEQLAALWQQNSNMTVQLRHRDLVQ